MYRTTLILIAGMLIFSSCSRNLNYFTERLNNEFDWTESDLKQIQFYLSEDIELIKASQSSYSDIENGKIRINDERKLDRILIEEGTPGTVLFTKSDDRFAVCFDEDTEKYLMFGPNRKAKGRYVLLAKEWNKGDGIIRYGGEEFITSSRSAYAALMVDIDNASRSTSNNSKATGRTIN